MHDNIKNGLKGLVEEKSYKPGEVAFWIPQFKIEVNNKENENKMVRDE